jgi:hypothetical protein
MEPEINVDDEGLYETSAFNRVRGKEYLLVNLICQYFINE